MEIGGSIRRLAQREGADFVGFADLARAHDFILSQGGKRVASFPRAISVGIAMPMDIVDQLEDFEDEKARISYRHFAYDTINTRLDQLTSQITGLVERSGHRARPVPASKRNDSERICAEFSNKLAANLSGLGWIGKSCLMVVPGKGPRVRWATVLTDAPLPVAAQAMSSRCGSCRKCVEICPAKAFTGRPFREDEPREVRFDAQACERYFDTREANGLSPVCGLCVWVCPHGRGRD